MQIGEYLKTKREKIGLTQGQVSNKLGYSSPQFISNIERGSSLPPLSILKEISKLLKLNDKTIMELLLEQKKKQIRSYL